MSIITKAYNNNHPVIVGERHCLGLLFSKADQIEADNLLKSTEARTFQPKAFPVNLIYVEYLAFLAECRPSSICFHVDLGDGKDGEFVNETSETAFFCPSQKLKLEDRVKVLNSRKTRRNEMMDEYILSNTKNLFVRAKPIIKAFPDHKDNVYFTHVIAHSMCTGKVCRTDRMSKRIFNLLYQPY